MVYMTLKTPKAKIKPDSSEWDSRKDFNKTRKSQNSLMGNAEERRETSVIPIFISI